MKKVSPAHTIFVFHPLPVFVFAILVFLCGPTLRAGSHDWDVAVFDKALAETPASEPLVKIGDMYFNRAFLQSWRNSLAQTSKSGLSVNSAFATTGTGVALWTSGTIPYNFDSTVTTSSNSARYQQAFINAANEWAGFANLHFVVRTTQTAYVTVALKAAGQGEGGDAVVGMSGTQQFIHIGPNSWNHGTLCHEIGHTLGLVHEHQRSDRDSYVTILTQNILSGQEGNFTLLPGTLNQGAYDWYSVMHYSRAALSSNGQDTIEPKTSPIDYSQYLNIMGNVFDRVLSASDRAGMAALYGAGPLISGTVTNTNDSGAGSLRTALYYSIDHPNTTVSFRIPNTDPNFSGGVFTIKPSDTLPTPGAGTTVDATTQTAFTGNTNANGPEVLVSGTLTQVPDVYGDGIALTDSNCTVRGLILSGFRNAGVRITGTAAKNETVADCYLGTDASGATALPNSNYGIAIDTGATGCFIGGTTAAALNVISGNAAQGIVIHDAGTINNTVQGNYIGLNSSGTAALANGYSGILIYNGAQANVIGGITSNARNVISGNTKQGVAISDAGTTGNSVQGNYIGTNPAGSASIPNGWAGVDVFNGAQSNTIGGSNIGAGNLLSGNTIQGVKISGTGSDNNVIQGNLIGTNANGNASLANGSLASPASGIDIFASAKGTIIGGAGAGARNVISGNSGAGITISQPGTNNSVITGNYVGLNSAGTAAVANGYPSATADGIAIYNTNSGTIVGGTVVGFGNVVSGNTRGGISVSNAVTNTLIAGNFVGVNAAGTLAVGNAGTGVALYNTAQNCTIGGTSAAARNVISGNDGGVSISNAGTTGNVVLGNYIGTNATGSAAIANSGAGIAIFSAATSNTIGGTLPGSRNVIAGNTSDGIFIGYVGTTGNLVQSNYIGVGADGTTSLPNTGNGVQLYVGASSNTIGGTAGTRNIIANNGNYGVAVNGDPSTLNNIIQGNSIGVNAIGSAAGNTWSGVAVFGGAQGTQIGGIAIGASNIIARNGLRGVEIDDAASINNSIRANSIFGNGNYGIALYSGNNSRAHPTLTTATAGVGTAVAGTLASVASTAFQLDFFASPTADSSGFGQGATYLGSIFTTTNGSGNASFSTTLAAGVPIGYVISATATDAAGSTSDFSNALAVAGTDSDGDGIPDAWMVSYFGHATGQSSDKSLANQDADGDGMTNLQEFRAGTNPKNSASALRISSITKSGSDIRVSFVGVSGKTYRVDAESDLATRLWMPLVDQILGTGTTVQITDPGAVLLGKRFYRVVGEP